MFDFLHVVRQLDGTTQDDRIRCMMPLWHCAPLITAVSFAFTDEPNGTRKCVIADMEFTDADTEEDRQLKLRMLEIYNK
eukprot:1159526-Pelagomonas_calceolata.AAC.6